MPEPMVRADLDAGRLVHLQLLDFRGGLYPLQIAHMNESPPGPAGQWLIECLINQDDRVALSDQSQKAKRGSPFYFVTAMIGRRCRLRRNCVSVGASSKLLFFRAG
jgi:hypothetical protein